MDRGRRGFGILTSFTIEVVLSLLVRILMGMIITVAHRVAQGTVSKHVAFSLGVAVSLVMVTTVPRSRGDAWLRDFCGRLSLRIRSGKRRGLWCLRIWLLSAVPALRRYYVLSGLLGGGL